jgi:Bacterial Ig-like domain (group 2)
MMCDAVLAKTSSKTGRGVVPRHTGFRPLIHIESYRRPLLKCIAGATLLALLAGCGGGGNTSQQPMRGVLASVVIAPLGGPMETGDFTQLNATGLDAYGTPVAVASFTWTSSDSTVAKVTADGLLVALAPGTAAISATSAQTTGALSVTVNAGITFSFGAEETVFQWSTDRCEQFDLPDVPAHVVRLADGTLTLMASAAPHNFTMFGADFASLHKSCAMPAFVSDDNYYPETYDNQEWIHSLYREGSVIHALVTNEYHDPFAPNCSPGDTSSSNPCWYNSITYAFSTDDGHTYTHATPPGHVVAPPTLKWDPQGPPPPYGYFFPSNIVLASDGFRYALFQGSDPTGNARMCLMRTQTVGDPASWRAWDGVGFGLQMTSPYQGTQPALCGAVASPPNTVGQPTLTYNTYLGKYMMIGGAIEGGPADYLCGIFYSLSSDLIHWSPLRLAHEIPIASAGALCRLNGASLTAFPSVIDHNDATVNFEQAGRTPYVYYSRFNIGWINRDLVRVPVTITAH